MIHKINKKQPKENLSKLAMRLWTTHLDEHNHDHNAIRHMNYQLSKYEVRPSEVLEKIKKCKYSKRMY